MKSLYRSNVRFVFIPLVVVITFFLISRVTGLAPLVPSFEPVTMILLGIGLLGLARFRRNAP